MKGMLNLLQTKIQSADLPQKMTYSLHDQLQDQAVSNCFIYLKI